MKRMILSTLTSLLFFAQICAADVDIDIAPVLSWGASSKDIQQTEGVAERRVLKYAKTYGDVAVIVSYFFDAADRLIQVTVAAEEPTQAQLDALREALKASYTVSKDEKSRIVVYDETTIIELRWKKANWLITYQPRG